MTVAETHDRPGVGGVGPHHQRYPGSPPFGADDLDRQLFRGRDVEADFVLHSILSTHLFLLYSQSGLGKSSLMNAAVMHELRARGRWPVAVRLNDPGLRPVDAIRAQIEEAAAKDPDVELSFGEHGTGSGRPAQLWDLLGELEVWRGNELQELVLVLDQFEELFTLPWDEEVRRQFIRGFGEVVRGHRYDAAPEVTTMAPKARFVVIIREDSLGELQVVEHDIPQILRNRFRLLPLDRASATSAIVEPAALDDDRLAGPPFEYTDAAISEILGFLTADRDDHGPDGSIDPSQLQIVCQYVERSIVPQKAEGGTSPVRIDAADLGGRSGLDQILSRFYRRTVESLPSGQTHLAEELCEHGLINRAERRLSLEQGQIHDDFGVTPATLHALVDGRLLRADPRVGSVYYELAHDTLVPAVLRDRAARIARRRQRRNRILLVVAAVAVVAALVAVAIVAASGDDSSQGDAAGVIPPPPPALLPGETLDASLDANDPARQFAVAAPPDGFREVSVTPDGDLDVAVAVTGADGGRRLQDQLGNGGVERIVLPPGTPDAESTVEVTSLAPPDASFSITTTDAAPVAVEPGTVTADELAAEGDLVVFALTVDPDEELVVDAVPQLPPGAAAGDESAGDTAAKATLDPTIEVLDATTGALRAAVDAGGPGVIERTVVSEPGSVFVVVRGKSTIGPFALEVTDVSPEVAIGEPAAGAIDEAGGTSEFTFVTQPGAAHAVLVVPELQFDAVVDVTDGAAPRSVDRVRQGEAEVALVVADADAVDLAVSGFASSEGSFDLTVSGAATTVEPDVGVSGTGLQAYDLPVDDGVSMLVGVEPLEEAEVEVLWFLPDGTIGGTALGIADQPASITVAGEAGVHRVVVVPRQGADGPATTEYRILATSEQAYEGSFQGLLDEIAVLEGLTEQYLADRVALEAQIFGGEPVPNPGADFETALAAYQDGHAQLEERFVAEVQTLVAALDAERFEPSPFGDLDRARDAAVRHFRAWLDLVPEYQLAIELWTFDVLQGRTDANFRDDSDTRLRSFNDEVDASFANLCAALADEQPPSGSLSDAVAAECEV